jgi:regulator of protease activity HflC (stomatin/prohibitin superfamily)
MISTLILLAGVIISFGSFKAFFTEQGRNHLFKGLAVLGIFLLAAMIQPYEIERVDAGHVGVKFNVMGDNRGISKYEYRSGWVVINKWFSKLYEFPTFQQHIVYDKQQVITKGGFPADIKPSFNYSLKAGNVGDMFQNLRLNIKTIEEQWLQTAIVGAMNDVTNKWTVDSIFNHRERFEMDITVEANKRISKWFTISQLRTNITPPDALVNSIRAKTQAIQDAQVAENNKKVAEAEAQTKIAIAKGDSAQAVIAAAGEARAIKEKQMTITPLYIDYIRATKWNGQMPTTMAGSGAGLLLNVK